MKRLGVEDKEIYFLNLRNEAPSMDTGLKKTCQVMLSISTLETLIIELTILSQKK